MIKSITIPLPEDLGALLADLPEDERQAFAVAALREAAAGLALSPLLLERYGEPGGAAEGTQNGDHSRRSRRWAAFFREQDSRLRRQVR